MCIFYFGFILIDYQKLNCGLRNYFRFILVFILPLDKMKELNNQNYDNKGTIFRGKLKLCKQGVLYQWVIGTGGGLDGMTYNSHKWELYYLKRDTDLAKTLLERRELNGYRFR